MLDSIIELEPEKLESLRGAFFRDPLDAYPDGGE